MFLRCYPVVDRSIQECIHLCFKGPSQVSGTAKRRAPGVQSIREVVETVETVEVVEVVEVVHLANSSHLTGNSSIRKLVN